MPEKLKETCSPKIYERDPDTGVIRWRYFGEDPKDYGWPNYGNILKDEKEKCVSCDEETPWDVSTHISLRQCYVEGAGQLCLSCWRDIYDKRKCQKQ